MDECTYVLTYTSLLQVSFCHVLVNPNTFCVLIRIETQCYLYIIFWETDYKTMDLSVRLLLL